MTNPQTPAVPPRMTPDDDRDPVMLNDDDDLVATDENLLTGDDRPLDPDVDDDLLNSAAADERAATEGTLDGDVDDG
jgi:hypothetical protein